MKQNKSFYIQILVAVFLIASWLIYENVRDDRAEYQDVLNHFRSNHATLDIMTRSSDNLIRSAETAVERSPKQKPLVQTMKEIQYVVGDYYEFIDNLRSEIFEFDQNEIDNWQYRKPKYMMPIGYNSTKRVQTVLEKENALEYFEKNWKNTIDSLEKIYSVRLSKMLKSDIFSENELQEYAQKQRLTIKENTPLHQQLIEQKELHHIIFKYDVVHANALLLALQYELKSLGWLLLNNTIRLHKVQLNPYSPIIVMSTKETPQVGKSTDFEFFTSSYIALDNMEIRVNGKLYETKDGIATLNYTPKSAGMKYFKVDVDLQNPFTGKVDKFSKNIKKEVFE